MFFRLGLRETTEFESASNGDKPIFRVTKQVPALAAMDTETWLPFGFRRFLGKF